MISDAIYSIVKDVCDFFPLHGDISKTRNFGVYAVRKEPVRTKHDGIVGYKGTILVSIINDDIDECETLSQSVIDLFEATKATTIENTFINHILFENDQYDFDPEDELYYSQLQFNYSSTNE